MTGPREDETAPTDLSEYAWVAPPESWAFHDALDTSTGDACVVLGFRIGGRWGGLQLPYSVASDITLTLGSWLSDIANTFEPDAHDNGEDTQENGDA